MSVVVMDASALLALLLKEPGAALVRSHLDDAAMTTVNLAEVVSYYAKQGLPRLSIEALLKPFPIEIIPVDIDLSYDAGMLRPLTLAGGLSLGDRCCLALARRMNRPALTGERRWPEIAEAAGVRVELIR
ncbi:type II toxin-antitoxin system VapC family toxin [Bosea sp. PAMC 26642]|uniref:type II toxin-antitoxin system VapC family toxin n=1 Tax=Bosea sp. (strain PAMC 26642) TaxID=1792307 RepID=UPI0007704BDE|nr:type II toxin-antitoxin system VapC family toxin [Bosea sp. PAMC 26642]AMJ61692.1 twitching motility protein PilT [Bosea sp. PAMC 26642]